MAKYRINIGCGMTPTSGWLNYDNSFSVRLAFYPLLVSLLRHLRLLRDEQLYYIAFCRKNEIIWADASNRIPLDDNSAECVYSSHVLEHLHRDAADSLLCEIMRVLAPGGRLRIAVPDLQRMVHAYGEHGDADRLVEETLMAQPPNRSWSARLAMMIIGPRNHLWMYDGQSLVNLLSRHGFTDARIVPSGETYLADPGALDLREREAESVFVEAIKM